MSRAMNLASDACIKPLKQYYGYFYVSLICILFYTRVGVDAQH